MRLLLERCVAILRLADTQLTTDERQEINTLRADIDVALVDCIRRRIKEDILIEDGRLVTQGLRALRLWHWQMVREQSQLMERAPTTPAYLEARKKHTIHMQAVQFLNELFPTGDTAERDDLK